VREVLCGGQSAQAFLHGAARGDMKIFFSEEKQTPVPPSSTEFLAEEQQAPLGVSYV